MFNNCEVRMLQTPKAGNWRIKFLRLLIGRAIDKKIFVVHGSHWPELFFSHAKKIIVCTPDFLALQKHLPRAFPFQFSYMRVRVSTHL